MNLRPSDSDAYCLKMTSLRLDADVICVTMVSTVHDSDLNQTDPALIAHQSLCDCVDLWIFSFNPFQLPGRLSYRMENGQLRDTGGT